MDYQHALDELERAALISSDPAVSTAQRSSAESIILNFRKSKDSIDLCKYVLERTSSEHLRFDAAQVLRDNLMGSWAKIGQTEAPTLLAQQLINLLFNSTISYAVGRRLASVIAFIVKHQAIEKNGQERKELIGHLMNTVTTASGHAFVVATIILESVIAEHQFVAVNVKADHLFTFDLHFISKKTFENEELLTIFEGCLQYINGYSTADGQSNEADLERVLRIVEIILYWSFTNTNLPQRILSVVENDVNPAFKPPASWQRIVTNTAFESIFFDLHIKIRHSKNEGLVSRTLQFLSQILSMSGPLFSGRNARVTLLARLLPRFLELLEMPGNSKTAILALSDIIRKMLLFHRMTTLNSIDVVVLDKFFWTVGTFTCRTIEASVAEEAKRNVEDRVLRESTTRLLEAWTNVLSEPDALPSCIFPIAEHVFNSYLRGKLGPPLGFRVVTGDDEDDDEEGTDDVRFRDQLQSLGLFGRAVTPKTTEVLVGVMGQVLTNFDSLFSSGVGSPSNVFEDLHWILLIVSHFLAYETEGETNLIPKEIVRFSLESKAAQQLSITCVENALMLKPMPEGNVDLIIKLISQVISLGEYERRIVHADLTEYLSPEVTKNILNVLSRIAGIYLFYSEVQHSEMSDCFRAVWGSQSPVAGPFLDFILTQVRIHLEKGGESTVQTAAVELLSAATNSVDRARRALASAQFTPLVSLINRIGPHKRDLPCETYQKAVKSIMVVGNLSATEYWDQILSPLCLRFTNFFGISTLDKHREDARLEVTFIISGYIGIASSADSRVATDLFQRLVPFRHHVASIITVFYNYTDIVQLCLTFVIELSKRFLSYLTLEHAVEVYHEAVNVAKAYSVNSFGKVSIEKGAEDDKIMDLILLLDMMSSLLTKDLFDCSADVQDGEAKDPPLVTGTSVAIKCLSVILPLLSKDLFEYPEFGDKYFRLISYLSELDARAVFHMDSLIFSHLVETVSSALKMSNADQFNHCCDFITSLANCIAKNRFQGSENSELVKTFLGVFFRMTLTMTMSKDSLPSISGVLFSLISAFNETYEAIAREIIVSKQTHIHDLQVAFEALTSNLNFESGGDRQSRLGFRQRIEHFIFTVRAILES